MSYTLHIEARAVKGLRDAHPTMRQRLLERLERLADDPHPRDAKQLHGDLQGVLRVRVGDYRVSFTVDDREQAVRVWQVGPRESFYQRARGGGE